MLVGLSGGLSPPRGAHEQSLLDQVGFVHLLNGPGIFADGRGQRIGPDRTSFEFVDDGRQNPVVHIIQSLFVDFKGIQRVRSDPQIDVSSDLEYLWVL